jgi:hypothetical protein
MLPKLQNSSLAQTLKRENLAFQVQCTSRSNLRLGPTQGFPRQIQQRKL